MIIPDNYLWNNMISMFLDQCKLFPAFYSYSITTINGLYITKAEQIKPTKRGTNYTTEKRCF